MELTWWWLELFIMNFIYFHSIFSNFTSVKFRPTVRSTTTMILQWYFLWRSIVQWDSYFGKIWEYIVKGYEIHTEWFESSLHGLYSVVPVYHIFGCQWAHFAVGLPLPYALPPKEVTYSNFWKAERVQHYCTILWCIMLTKLWWVSPLYNPNYTNASRHIAIHIMQVVFEISKLMIARSTTYWIH